jgi:hypothetical protein
LVITAGHARIAHKARKKGTGSRPWLNRPNQQFGLRAVCLSPFSVRNTSVIRCSRPQAHGCRREREAGDPQVSRMWRAEDRALGVSI